MLVLMGTTNPGKIEGARRAFETYFDDVEIRGIEVNSNVSNQPVNEEILQGAKNRVAQVKAYAIKNQIQVAFYIASEAGITNVFGEWIDINLALIEDNNGLQSIGISQGFPIPEKYIEEIKSTELGALMDRLFNGEELGKNKGGINYLTKEKVSRVDLTENAFIMALIKFINGKIWK